VHLLGSAASEVAAISASVVCAALAPRTRFLGQGGFAARLKEIVKSISRVRPSRLRAGP
jgi:hypothetical protein